MDYGNRPGEDSEWPRDPSDDHRIRRSVGNLPTRNSSADFIRAAPVAAAPVRAAASSRRGVLVRGLVIFSVSLALYMLYTWISG